MAVSTIERSVVQKASTTAIPQLNCRAERIGNIKVLNISSPTSAMTYNTAYACPIVDSDFYAKYAVQTEFIGNDREFRLRIYTDNIVLTPLTNTLPSDGKPILNVTVVYI